MCFYIFLSSACTIGLLWVKTVASNEDVPSSAVPTFDIPCTTPTALAISVVSTNRLSLHYCGIVLSIGGVSQHCVTWTRIYNALFENCLSGVVLSRINAGLTNNQAPQSPCMHQPLL